MAISPYRALGLPGSVDTGVSGRCERNCEWHSYGGLRVNLGDTRAFLVGFCSFKVLLDGNQSVSGAGTTGISRYRRQWSL